MFFIFGLRTKVTRSGVVTEVCRNCGNQAAQVITRRSTKFSLFFVPLIPIRTQLRAAVHVLRREYDVDRGRGPAPPGRLTVDPFPLLVDRPAPAPAAPVHTASRPPCTPGRRRRRRRAGRSPGPRSPRSPWNRSAGR